MKDKSFENIVFPSELMYSEFGYIVLHTANQEYSEALQLLDDYIEKVEDAECKNIAALMSLQILALAGYKEISAVLLKAMLKNLKTHSRAENLCQRTINNI